MFSRAICLHVENQNGYGSFGSVAVIETHSSRMTALGWKADIRPG
jgi:hypothetical protein